VPGVQAVPSASGNVDVSGIVSAAVTAGQLVFLSDGSWGPAGQWALATNQSPWIVHGVVGIVTAPAGVGSITTIRTSGRVTGLSGLVVGALYYVSDTAGAMTLSPFRPSIWTRYVGQADTTTSLVLYANPPELAPAEMQDYSGNGVVAQFPQTGARTVRLANTALLTIQGIKAGYHGQRLRFINANTSQVDFAFYSASAAVPERLYNFATSAPTSIMPTGSVDYEYDASSTIWRLVAHEQGDGIAVPFSASDFTASGGGTWTVSAGAVVGSRYTLRGKFLHWSVYLSSTTIGGAPTALLIRVPGKFLGIAATAWAGVQRVGQIYDAGGQQECIVGPYTGSTDYLSIQKNSNLPFAAGASPVVLFSITMEVT